MTRAIENLAKRSPGEQHLPFRARALQDAMYIGISRTWQSWNAAKALSAEPKQWLKQLSANFGSRLEKGVLLQGSDIYEILKDIGVTHLHQANSVITSCTYLRQGGIVSRGFAEDHRLQQSSQPTDELDRKYGIWNTIFLPHVDIHDRQGQTKAPNLFGPVLFVLDLDVLLRLPPGTEVRVTKRSPAYWYDTEPDSARWFQNAEEVAQNLSPDDLHRMLGIQIPSGKLDFPNRRARIILDDPQRQLLSGVNAYTHAEARLREAAAHGRVEVSIERRKCQTGCICSSKYAAWSTPVVDFYFG